MIRSTAKHHWIVLAGAAALALATFSTAAHSQQFALRDGETVVFYGDSITAQRLYSRLVEEFVLTRYPAMHVRFINAGVPGDTAYGGYAGKMAERVKRDVAPFQPAMITVLLGMNDGGWGPESAKIDAAFQDGYHALLQELHNAVPGAEMTLICSTPYDEITHGTEFPGYSQTIDRNADDVSQIAAGLKAAGDNTISLADFHHPLVDALERAKARFPQLAPLLIPDHIHPSETGHWIMAAALMSAWHVDPFVSRLALNANSVKVVDAYRSTVTNLEKPADGLTWTQIDEALPLPLDFNHAMTPVLLDVSDIAAFDQLILKVDSLEAGNYQLSIDAKPIAVFSSEQLQHGVNLALYKTPMLDQARDIDWSEERRSALDEASFILSAEVKQSSTSATAQTRLRDGQDELAVAIRAKLHPTPHQYELRRR
jgi:lysophospholipase L1-like esterase